MSLTVLEPGLESRVVDLGRPRTRSLGVPVGGAADRRSLILGNSLLGNPPDAAALEVTLKGPRLRAEADVGCVLFGTSFDPLCDGNRIEVGRTFTWHAGQELVVGTTNLGVRAYLCVRGGFTVTPILDSRSALGPVKAGDILPCGTSRIHARWCPEVEPDRLTNQWAIPVVPGLQAAWFDDAEFFECAFTVTPECNRMGLRLKGKPLAMPNRELVSEAVCPGAIQVTPDGQCIVLGVDGQTIGGYPKIGHIIQESIDTLGQVRPGDTITFVKTDLALASRLNRNAREFVQHWSQRLRLSLDAFPGERRFA